MLAAAWTLAAVLTLTLDRVRSTLTPGWQVRVLGIGAIALAVATLGSTSALACAAGVYAGLRAGALWTVVGIVVVLAAWRPLRHLALVRSMSRAADEFRRSADRVGAVLIVDDLLPEAFAVPGRPAVVVATSGLRTALSEQEFQTVIRHEWAHLRFRHHVYIQLVEVAACLNPLLRRWCRAIRFAAERDADEYAARPDRATAARALAKAALVTAGSRRAPLGRLALSEDAAAVAMRVRALRDPKPHRQRAIPLVAAVVMLAVICADLVLTADWVQDRLTPEAAEVIPVVFG